MTVPEQKQIIRAELRRQLEGLSASLRESASSRACALLPVQRVWREAQVVFFYSPLPNELNIWALVPEALKAGKTVLLPKFDTSSNSYHARLITDLDSDLLPGKYGINEPNGKCPEFPLNRLDLTLVPGIAFAPTGARLGRGRGYYDRLLAETSGVKCGVAFDEQLTDRLPVEPHDVSVDCILTPSRWIAVRGVTE